MPKIKKSLQQYNLDNFDHDLAQNLKAWYRLNDGIHVIPGESQLSDSSGNNLSAIANNDTSTLGTPSFCRFDSPNYTNPTKGLELSEATKDFIQLPTAGEIGIARSSYTISCWAKLPSNPGTSSLDNNVLLSIVDSTGADNRVWLCAWKNPTELRWMSTRVTGSSNYMFDNGSSQLEGYDDGEWHHVVVTCKYELNNTYVEGSYEGDHTYTLYIDGSLIEAVTEDNFGVIKEGDLVTIGSDLNAGGYTNVTDRFYTGCVSNMAFWNTCMSDEQVQRLYQVGIEAPWMVNSGFINNPPRTLLRTWDNATGSYPTTMRVNPTGRSGTYKGIYDDTNTIIYDSSYSHAELLFKAPPIDSTTVTIEDASSRKITFEFQRGKHLTAGNTEVDIGPEIDTSRIAEIFAKSVNISGLKINARANKGTVSLRQLVPGVAGNSIVTINFPKLSLYKPFRNFEGFKRRPSIGVSRSRDYNPSTPSSLTGSFYTPNLNGIDVSYPTLLHGESKWKDHRIASPNIGSDITVKSVVPKGISDVHLTFTKGEDLGAFDDSLLNISGNDSFYDEGLSHNTIEGFSAPLKSKTQVVIELDCVDETVIGMDTSVADNPGHRYHNMAYYNFSEKRWVKQGPGINVDAKSGPGGGWSTSTDHHKDFIKDACIGFSRGIELPVSGTIQASRPISNFGFPSHPKFSADKTSTYNMSSVISKPFLLEKFSIEYEASWEESSDSTTKACMFSVNDDGTISPVDELGNKNDKAVINNFFILNQRPWAGDYSFKTKLNRVIPAAGEYWENDAIEWQEGEYYNLEGQIPDYVRTGIEQNAGPPDQDYVVNVYAQNTRFETSDNTCGGYPGTSGPYNIMIMRLPTVSGTSNIDGFWGPDISSGQTLTIQYTDDNGTLPTISEVADYIENSVPTPTGTGSPIVLVYDPTDASRPFDPPSLPDYYNVDYITLSCHDYVSKFVTTSRELVTYGQAVTIAPLGNSSHDIYSILDDGLAREIVEVASTTSGAPHDGLATTRMFSGGTGAQNRYIMKGISQRPERFSDGHAYSIGARPGGTAFGPTSPAEGLVFFKTSHTGVRTGLENELSTSRAYSATTTGTEKIGLAYDIGPEQDYINSEASTTETAISRRVNPHSPYVLMPGDELIFGFQSACPYSFFASVDEGPGSKLTLSPGATVDNPTKIKITLYGSLISNKKESHDPLNQPLTTNALHESLGEGNNTSDQFDVDQLGYHAGNYLDDQVSGNIFEQGPYASVTELSFNDYQRVTGLDPKVTRNCLYIEPPSTASLSELNLPYSFYEMTSGGPATDPDCTSSRLLFQGTLAVPPYENEQYKGEGRNLFDAKIVGEQWVLPYRDILESYPTLPPLKYLDENRIEARGGGGSPECGTCGGVDINLQSHEGKFDMHPGSGRVTSSSGAIVAGAVNYRTGDFHIRFDGVLQGPRSRKTANFFQQFIADEQSVAGPLGHTPDSSTLPTPFSLSTNPLPVALWPSEFGFEDPSSNYVRGSFSTYAMKTTPGYLDENILDLGLGGIVTPEDGTTGGAQPISFTQKWFASQPGSPLSSDSVPGPLRTTSILASQKVDCPGPSGPSDTTMYLSIYGGEEYEYSDVMVIPGYYRPDSGQLSTFKALPFNLGATACVGLEEFDSTDISSLLGAKTILRFMDISTQQIAGKTDQATDDGEDGYDNDPRYLFDDDIVGSTGPHFSSLWASSNQLAFPFPYATSPPVWPSWSPGGNPVDPGPCLARTITVPIASSAEYTASPIVTNTLGRAISSVKWSNEKQAKAIYYSIISYQAHISRAVALASTPDDARNICTWLLPYDVMLIDTDGDAKYDTIIFEPWIAGSVANNAVVFKSMNLNANPCNINPEWQNYILGSASPSSDAYDAKARCTPEWPKHGEYFSSLGDPSAFATEFIGGIDYYDAGAQDPGGSQYDVITLATVCETYIDIKVRPSADPDAVYKGDIGEIEYWDGTPFDDVSLNTFTFRIYFNDYNSSYMSYITDPALPTVGGIVLADSGGTTSPNFDGGIYVNDENMFKFGSVNWISSLIDDSPLTTPQLSQRIADVLSNPTTRIRVLGTASGYSSSGPGWKTLGEIFAWQRLSFDNNGGKLRISDKAGILGSDPTDIQIITSTNNATLSSLVEKKQVVSGDQYVQGNTYFQKTRQVKSRASGSGFLPSPIIDKVDMPYPGIKGSFFRNVKLTSESDRYYDTVTPSPVDYHKKSNKRLLSFFGTHLTVGEPNPGDNGQILPEKSTITCSAESVRLFNHPILDDDVYDTTLEGCWFTIHDGNNRPYNIWYDVIGVGDVGVPPIAPSSEGILVPITEIQRGASAITVASYTAEAIAALPGFTVEYDDEKTITITNTSNGAATDISFPGVVGEVLQPSGLVGIGAPAGAGSSIDGTGPQTQSGKVVNNTSSGWTTETIQQGTDSYPGYSSLAIDDNWLAAYPFEPKYSGLRRMIFKEDNESWDTYPGDDEAAEEGTFGSSGNSSRFTTMFVTGSVLGHNMPSPWEGITTNNYGAQGFISDEIGNIRFGDSKEVDENIYKFYFGSGNGWSHSPILSQSANWRYTPQIRGWKYGLMSALELNSNAIYRGDSYGQYRDMMEQRVDTTFFKISSKRVVVSPPPVKCAFIDSSGTTLPPYDTQSQNISTFCTSSLPFFDDSTPRSR